MGGSSVRLRQLGFPLLQDAPACPTEIHPTVQPGVTRNHLLRIGGLHVVTRIAGKGGPTRLRFRELGGSVGVALAQLASDRYTLSTCCCCRSSTQRRTASIVGPACSQSTTAKADTGPADSAAMASSRAAQRWAGAARTRVPIAYFALRFAAGAADGSLTGTMCAFASFAVFAVFALFASSSGSSTNRNESTRCITFAAYALDPPL